VSYGEDTFYVGFVCLREILKLYLKEQGHVNPHPDKSSSIKNLTKNRTSSNNFDIVWYGSELLRNLDL